MSVLHVRHIQKAFTTRFSSTVDLSDLAKRAPAAEREQVFLSRALAAYAVVLLASAEAATAGGSVTDQFGDNGVDAVYVDPADHRIYIVQSKWVKNGTSGVELGDLLKFLHGVSDIVNGKFAAFGSKLSGREAEILAALDLPSARIVLVLVHTSTQKLSPTSLRPITDLLKELNDASDIAEFIELGQAEVHRSLSGTADGAPIDLEVLLTEWGHIKEPHKAYYGQLSAADVVAWYSQHGDRLFSKNLRKTIPTSEINRTITDTARKRPDAFWYFNNGITVLCQRITKKVLGGSTRASGVFDCAGVSIVNGAQTVGSLATAAPASSDAKVMARFISLEQCPEGFAADVTRATNMQNRVDNRDFAALDPTQDRLRSELLLEGRTYSYKTGDSRPSAEKGCSIDEATVALACSRSDVGLAVIAKREIGRLWDDIEKAPYKLLFNNGLSGLRLWRLVELLRAIDASLKQEQDVRIGRPRQVAVHGNRFIARQVFGRLDLSALDDPDLDFEPLRQQAGQLVSSAVTETETTVTALFPTSYIQSLFKNASKCLAVHDTLTAISAAPSASPPKAARGRGKARPTA